MTNGSWPQPTVQHCGNSAQTSFSQLATSQPGSGRIWQQLLSTPQATQCCWASSAQALSHGTMQQTSSISQTSSLQSASSHPGLSCGLQQSLPSPPANAGR